MKKILYAKPSIGEKEYFYVNDAIKNGWGENCYDYLYRFQDAFKAYLDTNYAIATSSATGALHMALAAIGIKPGDEVIVADINWIASVAPIVYLGAKPVFVDVDENSLCIDHKKIEKAINKKTKAIILVHLYGNLAEIDEILEIAKKNDLYVIEDTAEALGSEYKNRKAGSYGDFSIFSFHGTKTVCTGEGGMLVVNNSLFVDKIETLSNHGRKKGEKRMFYPSCIGFKYKMSNLQAAVGLAQMERIEELVSRKREIFTKYKAELSELDGIFLNPEKEYTKNSYWMTTLIYDKNYKINNQELIERFQKENIDIRPIFYPLSSLDMFEKVFSNITAYDIYDRGINLPSYHEIDDEQIAFVCKKLKDFFRR